MWNLLKGNNKDTRTTWFLADFTHRSSVSKIDFEQVGESWECVKRNSSIIFANLYLPYFDGEGSIFQGVCKRWGLGTSTRWTGDWRNWWGYFLLGWGLTSFQGYISLWSFYINFCSEIWFQYPDVWTNRSLYHNRCCILC